MYLDLPSILNLVSTAAIVGALVFTALQVRAANSARRDQAAVALIQTTQNSSWTDALNLLFNLRCRFAPVILCLTAPLSLTLAMGQPASEDRAITELTRKLEKNPRPQIAAQLYADRAEAYRAKDDFTRTEKDAREAIRLDPLNGDAHVELGAVYYQQDKDEQALAEFNRAVELRPYSAWCRMARGADYLDLLQFERAVVDFKAAIRLAPRSADAYCGLANAYAGLREPDKALVQFDEAIGKDPTVTGAHRGRANILLDRGLYEKALSDINLAIRHDPPGLLDLYLRGQVYRRMGRKDLATADLRSVSKMTGQNSAEEQFRGKALAELGEPRAALAALTRGSESYPLSANILNERAWLEATESDPAVRDGAGALRDARRSCELSHWKSGDSIDTLAAACAATGDYGGAIKYDERALPISSKSTAIEIGKHLESFRRHQSWREDPVTYLPSHGGD